MQKITSVAGLKHSIQVLEIEQIASGRRLNEHFYLTCHVLRPVNLLRGTLNDLASSPSLIDSILGTLIGLATGYLSKKIFIGTSGNIFRKLFGIILQLGVTKAVAQHPEAVKSFGEFISQNILSKKQRILRSRDS
ncbi:MAG: hypothetical protein NTY96_06170 [Bacteroidetes bacterium]|nr:hypothetical protein [Bacteroidota bacterium]